MPSTTIDQALHVHLLDQSTVTTVINMRLHWTEAPQDEILPYAVYFIVSDPHEPAYFERPRAGQARVQFSIFDKDKFAVLAIANIIRNELEYFRTIMDGIVIRWIKCTGTRVFRSASTAIFQGTFDAMVEYFEP